MSIKEREADIDTGEDKGKVNGHGSSEAGRKKIQGKSKGDGER